MINGRYLNYQEFSKQAIEDIQNITFRNFPELKAIFGCMEHPDDPGLKVDTFRFSGDGKENIYPEYNLWDWYQQYCYLDNGDIAKTVERMGQQYERDICEAEKKRLEERIAELDKQVPPKWVTELNTMLECLDNYRREQNKAFAAVTQQLENMGVSIENSMLRTLGKEDIMQYVAEGRNEKPSVPKEEQEKEGYSLTESMPADMDKETQHGKPEAEYQNYGENGRNR